MNEYTYTTFEDLTASEREVVQSSPERMLELRLNKIELSLQKAADNTTKEKQFYKAMDTVNTLNAYELVSRRSGMYPELLKQFEAHLQFTKIPKMAAIEFVDSLNSKLIDIEVLLRTGDSEPEVIAEKITQLRKAIPSRI
ncbi:TPA: hypothetical protein NKP48_004169 [Vibrio parahaemolyticus]|nr:hypothetical protein [Vibrio parahaemolyticus]